MLIANNGPLGPEWLDHPLKGDWEGHRECHIGGDFLLAYKVDDSGKTGMIVFVRAGTHAELFSLKFPPPPSVFVFLHQHVMRFSPALALATR